ncbi:MAG: hypothetical protein HRU35_06880 [Rickettsiaceae bacterium]|nr:hypothetical protein [Rickettsiaceae bacterium]
MISNATLFIKDTLKGETKTFFDLIKSSPDYGKIINKLDSLNLDNETYETVLLGTITLIYCLSNKLDEVCRIYEINQGHLAYEAENSVNIIVRKMTLQALIQEKT